MKQSSKKQYSEFKLQSTDYIRKRGSEDVAKLIGTRIKGYRLREGHSQAYLARKYGISKNSFSCYERGLSAPPIDFVLKLCDDIGCSLDQFFDLETTQYTASVEEEALLRIFEQASPEGRRYIIEAARGIAIADANNTKTTKEDN